MILFSRLHITLGIIFFSGRIRRMLFHVYDRALRFI
jgi:hypothetical protein